MILRVWTIKDGKRHAKCHTVQLLMPEFRSAYEFEGRRVDHTEVGD